MKHLWTRTKHNIHVVCILMAGDPTPTRAQTVKALMASRSLSYRRANHTVHQAERFCALLIPWKNKSNPKSSKTNSTSKSSKCVQDIAAL